MTVSLPECSTSLVAERDAERGLVEHMRRIVGLRNASARADLATCFFSGIEGLLLEHGRVYKPRMLRKGIRKRELGRCFENAMRLARRSRRYRYVEGIAICHMIPVHHAWNVDESGSTVDTTWPIGSTRWDICETAYVGIEIDMSIVSVAVAATGIFGPLGYFEFGSPFLRRPFDPAAALEALRDWRSGRRSRNG